MTTPRKPSMWLGAAGGVGTAALAEAVLAPSVWHHVGVAILAFVIGFWMLLRRARTQEVPRGC